MHFLPAQIPAPGEYFNSLAAQDEQIHTALISGGTILFLCIAFGVVALVVSWQDLRLRKLTFRQYAFSKPLFVFSLISVCSIILLNLFAPQPDLDKAEVAVKMGEVRDLPELSVKGYAKLIQQYPDSLELHMKYIYTHFQCAEEWRDMFNLIHRRNDKGILRYYNEMIYDQTQADLGNFCSGLVYYYMGNSGEATFRLSRVNDFRMPYVNYVMGSILSGEKTDSFALEYFRKEIALKVFAGPSYRKMAEIYFRQKNLPALDSLMQNEEAVQNIPEEIRRYTAIMVNKPQWYFPAVLAAFSNKMNAAGLVAALMILIIWMLYIRSIDLFSPESWPLVVLTILEGGLYSLLALPLYDFAEFMLGFDLNGSFFNDVMYCIFGIGLIEELVKIIPLVLFMYFTRVLKEPIDYIVFSCLSALGFATVENLLYFTPEPGVMYHGRGLVSVSGHLCYSAVIAYFVILAKFRYKRNTILFLLMGLLAAATLHGMYDFFLFGGSWLTIPLALGIHLIALMLLGFFINNALNQSPFIKEKKGFETGISAQYLAGGLLLVLVFEFATFAFTYGAHWANYKLMISVFTGSYSMAFAAINLNNIDVMQGEWLKFRPRFSEFRKNYNKAVGLRIRIRPIQGSTKLELPDGFVFGTILQRVKLNLDNRYYLVKLERPVEFFGREWEYILVRPKSKQQIFEPGAELMVYFIVVLDWRMIAAKQKDRNFFRFIDWAVATVPEKQTSSN